MLIEKINYAISKKVRENLAAVIYSIPASYHNQFHGKGIYAAYHDTLRIFPVYYKPSSPNFISEIKSNMAKQIIQYQQEIESNTIAAHEKRFRKGAIEGLKHCLLVINEATIEIYGKDFVRELALEKMWARNF